MSKKVSASDVSLFSWWTVIFEEAITRPAKRVSALIEEISFFLFFFRGAPPLFNVSVKRE